jgi:nicotinamide riboside kinase
MKIAITGAQSTGKTTLLNALKSEFSNTHLPIFLDEVTRKVREYGVSINEDGGNMTQVLIMNSHVENILHEDSIMDRCALDGVVYTRWMYNKGLGEEWVMDYAERVFTLLIEKYDKIFYLIPEFDIEDDGVRSTDIDFRNEIVTIFNEYIIECEIPVIQLTGSVDNRVSLIVEELKNE